jgi:hypothetical protein
MGIVKRRDVKYQAKLMVEAFGAERAYKIAHGAALNSKAQLAIWWSDVQKHIDYTPPPKERTLAERAYDRLVVWATEQGVEFSQNPHSYSVTIHSRSLKFQQ